MQRSEVRAASVVALVAAVLFALGDARLLESVIGVAACPGIVLIWFWGWRQYYDSEWPERMQDSRLLYLPVPLYALLVGGAAAFLVDLLGFGPPVRAVVGWGVAAIVAVLLTLDVRERRAVQPESVIR